jgi:hypothetical protein
MDSCGGISSTYTMGGILVPLDFLGFLLLARVSALSNFFCLFLRDSATYHPAPLRGRSLARGMLRNRTISGMCWLWSLIIFLIRRSLLSAVFIPHEVFTPQKYVHSSTRGSAEGGYPLCGVPAGGFWGQAGPQRGLGAKPPKQKLPCKSIL